ncbi:TetR/AcrR family transcriptional regulator [Streptomyces sp. SID14478]|uniref:TetR/AcrR family transcriptional regulator n=1 Tax=Streptomyces sp. SID14478 TaxID=2706073 RepID=UPI0013E09226|nr:TetR/AcrR family transcriptional regulator [Streptomyces sp. SID14478]NEB80866.1 TetR/AcrR family transcriptional regulator [Streptomyces sp. SID14478]
MTGQRSDARRNYARVLAAAETEVAAHGAQASLERIAREAGVGSATVRRHFSTRRALLNAVFAERVRALCERAQVLGSEDDTRTALQTWLRELLAYSVAARGLADALSYEPLGDDGAGDSCAAVIEAAGSPLLRRAVADGSVRGDVTVHDLVTLVVGIALATEHHSDPAAQAERVFRLAIEGLDPTAA